MRLSGSWRSGLGFVPFWFKPYLENIHFGLPWPPEFGSAHVWLKPYLKNANFGLLAARARICSFWIKALFEKCYFRALGRPGPHLFIFNYNLICKILTWGSWPPERGSVHFWLKPYSENIHFGPLAARARIISFLVKAFFGKSCFGASGRPSPDLFIFD